MKSSYELKKLWKVIMNKKLLLILMFAFNSNSILYSASADSSTQNTTQNVVLTPQQIALMEAINDAVQQILAEMRQPQHEQIAPCPPANITPSQKKDDEIASHMNPDSSSININEENVIVDNATNNQENPNKNPLQCSKCLRIFKCPQTLKKHTTAVHEPHPCPICGKNFARKYNIPKHIDAIHSLYQCPQCKIYYSKWEKHTKCQLFAPCTNLASNLTPAHMVHINRVNAASQQAVAEMLANRQEIPNVTPAPNNNTSELDATVNDQAQIICRHEGCPTIFTHDANREEHEKDCPY